MQRRKAIMLSALVAAGSIAAAVPAHADADAAAGAGYGVEAFMPLPNGGVYVSWNSDRGVDAGTQGAQMWNDPGSYHASYWSCTNSGCTGESFDGDASITVDPVSGTARLVVPGGRCPIDVRWSSLHDPGQGAGDGYELQPLSGFAFAGADTYAWADAHASGYACGRTVETDYADGGAGIFGAAVSW